MDKYHIEKNTVQETLIIPLYGRKICADHYPQLFEDKQAQRICEMLDYDFAARKKKMETQAGLFGALEVAQRHYDLIWEIKDYLKLNPEAAVVNLGCGLDDSFAKVDNGKCHGTAIFARSTACRSTSKRASSLRCWARPAAARPRCCA